MLHICVAWEAWLLSVQYRIRITNNVINASLDVNEKDRIDYKPMVTHRLP